MKKIICLFLTVSLILFAFSTTVMASGDGGNAAGKIQTAGTSIVNAILWCGYAIALGMVVFIGIKYILGSAEAKSNMKGAMVSWFIGAFIVFMCSTIVGWVLNVVTVDSTGDGLASSIIDAADGVK